MNSVPSEVSNHPIPSSPIPTGFPIRLEPSFVPLFALLGIAGFLTNGRMGVLDGLLTALLLALSATTMALGERTLSPSPGLAWVTPLGPLPAATPSPLLPAVAAPFCVAIAGAAILVLSSHPFRADHRLLTRLIWINAVLTAARLLPLPPFGCFRRISRGFPATTEQIIAITIGSLGGILLLAGLALSIEATLAGTLLLTASSLALRDLLRRSGRITGRFGRNRP